MEPISPEEIVQRLEAGDPDPTLQSLASQAAWEAFHDPWEKAPAEPQPSPGGGPMEPDAVQPLAIDMVDAFLKEDDYNFYSSEWGNRMAFFRYGPISDRVVRMNLNVGGRNQDVLFWRMVCDRRVDPPLFDLAYRLCNTWQNEYWFPRAFLEVPDPPERKEGEEEMAWNPSGSLVLDYQIPFPKGLSQEALNELIRRLVANSWDFWKMARERFSL